LYIPATPVASMPRKPGDHPRRDHLAHSTLNLPWKLQNDRASSIALPKTGRMLRNVFGLIIMPTIGELQQLEAKVLEKYRIPRQKYLPALDLGRYRVIA
jgi:hypothetical protein